MILGLGRYPGGGHSSPLWYSCLQNPHGQRSLADYSAWGHKESDATERPRTNGKSSYHLSPYRVTITLLTILYAVYYILMIYSTAESLYLLISFTYFTPHPHSPHPSGSHQFVLCTYVFIVLLCWFIVLFLKLYI